MKNLDIAGIYGIISIIIVSIGTIMTIIFAFLSGFKIINWDEIFIWLPALISWGVVLIPILLYIGFCFLFWSLFE